MADSRYRQENNYDAKEGALFIYLLVDTQSYNALGFAIKYGQKLNQLFVEF